MIGGPERTGIGQINTWWLTIYKSTTEMRPAENAFVIVRPVPPCTNGIVSDPVSVQRQSMGSRKSGDVEQWMPPPPSISLP